MKFDFTNFDDDIAFAQSLDSRYPMQLHLTEMLAGDAPTSVALAAKWILSPDAMLQGFVDAFNTLMSRTEFFDLDSSTAVSLRLRADIDSTDRMLLGWDIYIILDAVRLMQREGVHTPLNVEAIREARDSMANSDWEKFSVAIFRWAESIREVANWIRLRRLISSDATMPKGKGAKRQSRTATFEEYRRAWLSLEKENIEPSRENLIKVIRHQYEKTLGGDNFTRYRTRLLKERHSSPSAVRPPQSAD